MDHFSLLLGIVIVTALAFDFTNGFHDTANSMATTISTGALKPMTAVAMAASLDLAGAFLSVEVAKTISGGIVHEEGIRTEVIFAALVGAILWNLVTWLFGLPSSSSHALFGGLIGAAVMSAGWSAVNGSTVVTKVLLPAAAAPIVAGLGAMLATRVTYAIGKRGDTRATAGRPDATSKGYRAGQIASAAMVALAHGTNDAQKTMGIVTLALVTQGVLAPGSAPPIWVITAAGVAIAMGTYLGGWRIIRTLGRGITELSPQQGFAAQTSAATAILASSHLGFTLSTTQVCSGSVLGSGLGRKGGVVHWSTASRMLAAWVLTLPAAGLVGASAEFLTRRGSWGVALTGVLLVTGAIVIYALSRRAPVDRKNVNDPVTEPEEAPGVVTTAIAAVTPPPVTTAQDRAPQSPVPSAAAQPARSGAAPSNGDAPDGTPGGLVPAPTSPRTDSPSESSDPAPV